MQTTSPATNPATAPATAEELSLLLLGSPGCCRGGWCCRCRGGWCGGWCGFKCVSDVVCTQGSRLCLCTAWCGCSHVHCCSVCMWNTKYWRCYTCMYMCYVSHMHTSTLHDALGLESGGTGEWTNHLNAVISSCKLTYLLAGSLPAAYLLTQWVREWSFRTKHAHLCTLSVFHTISAARLMSTKFHKKSLRLQ